MKQFRIFLIGPSLGTQGGISSVIKIYREKLSDRFNFKHIPSYSGDSRFKDLLYFLYAIVAVLFYSIYYKNSIYHIHTASRGSFLRKSTLARVCLFFRKPVILHIHGAQFDQFIENSRPGKRKRILRLLDSVSSIVVLSYSWMEFLARYVHKDKITVIYNPSLIFDGRYKRRNNNIPNILFMGRLGQRKGTYDLIKAADKLGKSEFLLKMYGDGEVSEIKGIVRDKGLDKILVNSWVPHSEVGSLYETADILVLPSYAEGLPMSVLEAMGKGLPVISTKVGGIPEAVLDGENGFIIDPGDVEALAAKMQTLLQDKSLRERMGRRSLEIVREKFSVERIAADLQKLYRNLAS